MSLYNIEIFDRDFNYVSSAQVDEIEYSYDYLSISVNTLTFPMGMITAQIGNYIHISNGKHFVDGIISDVSESDTFTIKYKSFLSLFDHKVYANDSLLSGMSMEEWLANIIKSEFVTSSDTFNVIPGLIIDIKTHTNNTYLGLDKKIKNLYELIRQCFLKYQIVLTFSIDITQKQITLSISNEISSKQDKTIEMHLPNIFNKKISFNSKRTTINKITIVNQDNETESVTYYMGKDNLISQHVPNSLRIYPVVSDMVFCSAKDDKTFASVAYEKASAELKKDEYNNLVEATVLSNDLLVEPDTWQIGQRTLIKPKPEAGFYSILTGIKFKNSLVTLIFGSNRYNMTSILQRRLNEI